MIPLVDAEQVEEIRWDLIQQDAGLAMPERGVQVVCLADHCGQMNVKALC